MNVYDFDETIYDGDSSIDFYLFNLKRNPFLARKWWKQARAFLKYKRGKISKTEMKTVFYGYFKDIENIDLQVHQFWANHEHKIKSWYLAQKRDDDLIVSASPYFLLKPICEKLGIELIASVVDPKTGRNLEDNCYGAEKVRRIALKYDLKDIDEFYSDSYSDDPVAQYAAKSFMVKGDELHEW